MSLFFSLCHPVSCCVVLCQALNKCGFKNYSLPFLKKSLIAEGNETVTNCNALKMTVADGKLRFYPVYDMLIG